MAEISTPQRKHQAVDPRPVTVTEHQRPTRTDDGEFTWAGPPVFGDNEQALRHKIQTVEPAKAAQVHPHAVAPLATITTMDGRRLEPGDPVRPGTDIPARMLGYLRDLGTILSLEPEEQLARRRRRGDTHMITEGHNIKCPARSQPMAKYPGTLQAADLAEPGEPAREGRDWDFRVEAGTNYMVYIPPRPARPAKPAVDGREVIAKLESQGKIRKLTKQERAEIDRDFPEREEDKKGSK